jgi:indolepyruvate ferredoxin oxidoreductase beta subunit
MDQQIAISGLGGQGVLFVTRLLAETALDMGLDVLSSETHGMAMRGGAVISHLKVGRFASPLIRAGQADLAMFLTLENLEVHPYVIGTQTRVLVNAPDHQAHDGLDASQIAMEAIGRHQAANLVLLGYGLGKGYLFAETEKVRDALKKLSRTPEILETNQAALEAGLSRAG